MCAFDPEKMLNGREGKKKKKIHTHLPGLELTLLLQLLLSCLQSKEPLFYLQHHQALFVVVFSPKTNKENFEFLDQNRGLTSLEKYNFL